MIIIDIIYLNNFQVHRKLNLDNFEFFKKNFIYYNVIKEIVIVYQYFFVKVLSKIFN